MEKHGGAKKKMSKGAKAALITLGVLAALALVIALLGLNLLNKISRPAEDIFANGQPAQAQETPTPAPETSATPAPTPEPTPLPLSDLGTQTRLTEDQQAKMAAHLEDGRFINVLLLGVDRRGSSGNSNTDTMMIATIDKLHNRLKLTSLMRDMLVDIPEKGIDKMNSAANKGGIPLLFSTIERNFDIKLDNYVLVDFNMFESIVDELGGVTVKMTAEEISETNNCIAGLNKQLGVEYLWDGFVFSEPGNVKLSGKQALSFARVRKIDSDFSRTKRQYELLRAIFAKFMAAGVTKQYSMLEKLMPNVETNMANADIISCATSALGMDVSGITFLRTPADGEYVSGKYNRKSVVIADLPASAWRIHEFIYESDEKAETASVLEPGQTLPPRTPTIYQGADGNYYYYGTMTPVYGAEPTPESGVYNSWETEQSGVYNSWETPAPVYGDNYDIPVQ